MCWRNGLLMESHPSLAINMELLTEFRRFHICAAINMELLTEFRRFHISLL
jgi:hypothetical protein